MTEANNGQGQWFQRGNAAFQQEKARMDRPLPVSRFWLEDGKSKDIIWVEDEAAAVYEHEYRNRQGKWGNYLTCLQGSYNETPCCERIEVVRAVGHYTIVDIEGYFSKKNNKQVRYVLCDLAVKFGTQKVIDKEKEDEVSLTGKRYRITRLGDKAPRSGNVLKKRPIFPPKEGQPEVFVMPEDGWAKLYNLVTFRGEFLSKLVDEARKDAKARERFLRTFDPRTCTDDGTPQGQIVAKIPTFNFYQLLSPLQPKEVRVELAGAMSRGKDDKNDSGGNDEFSQGSESGGGGDSDDVPF